MLAKCANSVCTTPFRRLSEGKLFLVDSDNRNSEDFATARKKPPHKIEYFWLCDECARVVTLIFSPHTGIRTVPLPPAPPKASATEQLPRRPAMPEHGADLPAERFNRTVAP